MILRRWRSARWKRSVLDAWTLHHARSSRSLEYLSRALVRYSCLQGREILVHAAIDQLYDLPSLSKRLAAARARGAASGRSSGIRLRPKPARALARVLYRQQILDTDLPDAVEIYESLAEGEEQVLEPVDHGYLIDASTLLGRRLEAIDHLERYADGLRDLEAYTYLLANVLNPHAGGPGGEAEWLHQVNAPLVAHGLEPIELAPGDGPPFWRLACKPAELLTDGPLVSVLMPIQESNDATDVAIRSILAQSWQNLELIVVDDASSPAARERLKEWEERDARLRFIYSDVNRGAYCARNTAYELARGEFITVADKDDWHHPRKIELHARDLIDRPDELANMTSWSRVDENLSFLVRYAPIKMAHPSQPSLFFRRRPVKEALGYWDSVRKGADGEYKLRIQKVFGTEISPMSRVPLALSLVGRENLSTSDFGLGYEHPDRTSYKDTYAHWHRRIPGNADSYVSKEPIRRPFPAPTTFLPIRHGSPRFDVVFVIDLSADTSDTELIRKEILAGLDRDVRTAVVHLPDLMRLWKRHRPPADWLNDLILDGRVARLSLTDRADAELLVIGTPRILQFRPEQACELSPQRVVILAGEVPSDSAAGVYSPRTVADNVRSMFKVDVIWIPVDRQLRIALRRHLRRREIASTDWSGIASLFAQV